MMLKRFIVLAFIFICQNSFCQEYTFDKFLEFKGDFQNDIKFFLINSTNNTYFLDGSTYYDQKQLCGIIDYTIKQYHKFEVLKAVNSTRFVFVKTNKLRTENKTFLKYYFKEEKTNFDSLFIKTTLYGFRNHTMKGKSDITIEIISSIKNSLVDQEIINCFSHGYFLNTDYKTTFPFPSEIKLFEKNKLISSYSIINEKKIETKLIVN